MKIKTTILMTILITLMFTSCFTFSSSGSSFFGPSQEEQDLITAVLYNNKPAVESMLQRGVSPNARNVNGFTALGTAVSQSFVGMASLLIKYGADINGTDEDGASALFYAKKPMVQKWLIEQGADVNVVSRENLTAFEFWCLNSAVILSDAQKYQAINNMRSRGINVTKAQLEQAIWVSKSDMVQTVSIFKKAGINLDATKNGDNYNALIFAAVGENYPLMEALLAGGANPRHKNRPGDDALNLISMSKLNKRSDYEYLSVVRMLIANGADINSTDAKGNTPLCNAALADSLGRVKVLLGVTNCKVNARGQYGENAVFKGSSYYVLKALVDAGSNVNFESTGGFTPLFTVRNRYAVQYLIYHGADVNHIAKNGDSVLLDSMRSAYKSFKYSQEAAKIQDLYIGKVQVLIASGVNVNYESPGNGATALYYAEQVPMPQIVAILRQAGAK